MCGRPRRRHVAVQCGHCGPPAAPHNRGDVTANPYESNEMLSQYLLFHYGERDEILLYPFSPRSGYGFPVRCVTELVDRARLGRSARALDLGCAVGRSTFELARLCREVVGVDFSHQFIATADRMRRRGAFAYDRIEEGDLTVRRTARVPPGIDRDRVAFEQGDAMALRPDIGTFDLVLMVNLLDRLADPLRCLATLATLVRPGGQLVVVSPYTWLEQFTPRAKWLGGIERNGRKASTFTGLGRALRPGFTLERRKDMPFLIREHARKFTWGVADGTVWIRRGRAATA